jgi:hypothetical protein
MSLLTDELRKELPRLYAQQGTTNPLIYAKFFLPGTAWTWYISEGEQETDDYIFYGFTFGQFGEWGYLSLAELEGLRNRYGLPVESDLYFTPAPWKEIKDRHEKEHGVQA